jgi:hypothetical protein
MPRKQENCSIGHLCAETALLAPNSRSGGHAFQICDPNPPIAYGDMYRALHLLSAGRCRFPFLHAGLIFAVAHVLEAYHLLRSSVLSILPRLSGDLQRLPGTEERSGRRPRISRSVYITPGHRLDGYAARRGKKEWGRKEKERAELWAWLLLHIHPRRPFQDPTDNPTSYCRTRTVNMSVNIARWMPCLSF